MAKLALRGASAAKGTAKGKAGARAAGSRKNTAAQRRGFKKALAMYPELFPAYTGGGSSGGGDYVDRSSEF